MIGTIAFNDGWSVSDIGRGGPRRVTLPHDAMIEETRSAAAPSGSHGGFFPGGRYRYSKTWTAARIVGEQQSLFFEGVYGAATVRLNGAELAHNVSPYREFVVDLGDQLRDGINTLEIDVDNSDTPNSRWYTGSGIYRPVWLRTTGTAVFDRDGIRMVVRSVGDPAVVSIETEIDGHVEGVEVHVELRDGARVVASADGPPGHLQLVVPSPRLWSAESPQLYSATLELRSAGELVDVVEQSVGLRTVEVDPRHGLRINGERVLLRGACVHHDNGILGAVAHRDAEFRRARILKQNGFNAVRSSHNPLSRAFLEACDELGLYVLDELADYWAVSKTAHDLASRFEQLWPDDARSMVSKDRSHPSVIMYSIGNEIAETATATGVDTASRLGAFIAELDPTRPTSIAVNFLLNFMASGGRSMFKAEEAVEKEPPKASAIGSTLANVVTNRIGGIMRVIARLPKSDAVTRDVFATVEVAGYNYAWSRYRGDAKRYPDRIMMGSESMPGDIARIWPLTRDLPRLIGDFMWTGWDYLGETGIGTWSYGSDAGGIGKPFPHLIAGCGAIDITGVPGAPMLLARAAWGMLATPAIAVRPLDRAGERPNRTAWRQTDAIASWAWAGREGTRADIEVYSSDDEVELLLNGRSLGRRRAGEKHRFVTRFTVPYEAGELVAVGFRGGQESGRSSLRSAGPAEVRLTVESGDPHVGDGGLTFIRIEIADRDGTVEMLDDDIVTIEVTGPAGLAALGSAAPAPSGSFVKAETRTYYGRALAVLSSTGGEGPVTVTAQSARHGSVSLSVAMRDALLDGRS